MSRAERRQYQRMMKGQDPHAPKTPTGGGRPPPRRRTPREPRDWSFTRGFWLRSIGLAALVGVIGLSLVWSNGAEQALLAGAASAAGTIALLIVARVIIQRRVAAR